MYVYLFSVYHDQPALMEAFKQRNIRLEDDGTTQVLLAARKGLAHELRHLIDAKADLDAPDTAETNTILQYEIMLLF